MASEMEWQVLKNCYAGVLTEMIVAVEGKEFVNENEEERKNRGNRRGKREAKEFTEKEEECFENMSWMSGTCQGSGKINGHKLEEKMRVASTHCGTLVKLENLY